MRAAKQEGQIVLTFEGAEGLFFRRILQAIIRNYRIPAEALPAAVGKVWYSTAGCQSARMTADETRDWLEQIRAIKHSRLRLLQRCARALGGSAKGPVELRMSADEASTFMVALNDHRLFLGARFDIGEAELSLPAFLVAHRLKPMRRKALIEIDMLAFVVGVLLALIDPEAADWSE